MQLHAIIFKFVLLLSLSLSIAEMQNSEIRVRHYDLKFRVDRIRKCMEAVRDYRVTQTNPAALVHVWNDAVESYGPPSAASDATKFAMVQMPTELRGTWVHFRAVVQPLSHWDADGLYLSFSIEEKFTVPTSDAQFPAGPEGLVWVDGHRVGAIDREHRRMRLPGILVPGRKATVEVILFTGRLPSSHTLKSVEVEWRQQSVEKLYYNLLVGHDMLNVMDSGTESYRLLVDMLDRAVSLLDFRTDKNGNEFYASIPLALGEMTMDMPKVGDHGRVVALGHSHIDIAWLWEIAQTRHKAVRTFSTQLRLLEQYPTWKFMQSSPQIYQWIERTAPDVFAGIKKAIAAGRWEAEGAMWCEADTNVPNGESLVRQLLYGKLYFRKHFALESKMVWLPDVFGYSAALPQLFRLAQVPYFVTSKISWSQFNRFPYDAFHWAGIDGSTVLTQFITTPPFWGTGSTYYTYNSLMYPSEVKGAWDKFQQKSVGHTPLLTFGFGDGGGGPTEEMLEVSARMEPASLLFDTALGTMERLKERSDAVKLPTWRGELYLEYHRGTYTSQAWIKRANRKGEVLFQQTEWLLSLAVMYGIQGDALPLFDAFVDEVRTLWEEFLMLQFHDILPGSSTTFVYTKEARPMHARISSRLLEIREAVASAIISHCAVDGLGRAKGTFNSLWFDRDGVPAGGWRVELADTETFSDAASSNAALRVSPDGMSVDSRRWRISFDDHGRISEWRDRLAGDRDVLIPGRFGNEFLLFRDDPMMWSAWDIDSYYEEMPLPPPVLQSTTVVEDGSASGRVVIRRKYLVPPRNKSVITQDVIVYGDAYHMDRVDFVTSADWHDSKFLLKVAFPVNVYATEATHEIQFGHLRRSSHKNTQWDVARFETCAQRWVDVSEHGYGAALLNDCKYGNDVQESTIRQTLIKAPVSPDPDADKGHHEFTYSFLPHAGSFQEADVIREAARLNNPVFALNRDVSDVPPAARGLASSVVPMPPVVSPVRVTSGAGVVIDTMKPAERNGDDTVIVRLYESFGGSIATVDVRFDQPMKSCKAVDLLEEEQDASVSAVMIDQHTVRFAVRAFQIVTLRVQFLRFKMTD